jgi:hypothetical protein
VGLPNWTGNIFQRKSLSCAKSAALLW